MFAMAFCRRKSRSDIRPGISSIVVEGHASSEGDERLNLKLSQERSIAVVRESLDVLDSAGTENSSADHKCFLNFVSATQARGNQPEFCRALRRV